MLPCFSSCCAAKDHSLIPLPLILSNFRNLIPICPCTLQIFLYCCSPSLFWSPSVSLPPCGIQLKAIFAGRISGRRMMWPVHWMHLFTTMSLRLLDFAWLNTSSFLILSLQDIFKILRRQVRWKTPKRPIIFGVTLHISYAYRAVKMAIEFYNWNLTVKMITLDPQTVWSRLLTEQVFLVLLLTSFSISPTFNWMLSK